MKLKSTIQKLMMKLPEGTTLKIGHLTLLSKKHSPVVLFGAGVVGFGATVFLACRATSKVDSLVEETHKKIEETKNDESLTGKVQKKELTVIRTALAVETVKLYGPAVLIGMASVASLTGSHYLMSKRNVALAAAFAGAERTLAEYQKRVAETIGEEREREIRNGIVEVDIVEETDEGPVIKKMKKRGEPLSPYKHLYDELNKNWQRERNYNLMYLSAQQVHFQNLLDTRGYVFLNEVLKALGMKQTEAGQQVGWLKNYVDQNGKKKGDGFIDFGIFNDEQAGENFVRGDEKSIWLVFNCQGNILGKADFSYSADW
jgi:uncharacterized MnhB-related membrane protein